MESSLAPEVSHQVPGSGDITNATLAGNGATNPGVANSAGSTSGGVSQGNLNVSGLNGGQPVTATRSVTINCPVVLNDGTVRLTFAGGDAGVSYQVQGSTDLVNWITLTNAVVDTNGLSAEIDIGASKIGPQFYRAETPGSAD